MSLLPKIRAAFENSSYPNGALIFEMDSEGADAVFHGRSWEDISIVDLDFHSAALRRFTPEAFAYYLPAFMLAALTQEELGLVDTVIDVLCPPKNDPSRPSFIRRWSRLNMAQQQSAIAFLRHFEQRDPVRIQSVVATLVEHVG